MMSNSTQAVMMDTAPAMSPTTSVREHVTNNTKELAVVAAVVGAAVFASIAMVSFYHAIQAYQVF